MKTEIALKIQKKASAAYKRFLKSELPESELFPFDIPLSLSVSNQDFKKLRSIIADINNGSFPQKKNGYNVVMDKKNTRAFGTIELPKCVRFESFKQLASFQDKLDNYQKVVHWRARIIKRFPGLREWCYKQGEKLPSCSKNIPWLLDALAWFINNRNSGLYIREIPLFSDTKFIERHKKVLDKWCSIITKDSAAAELGISFEKKYGLKTPPQMVRFRFLDTKQPYSDQTVPLGEFMIPERIRRIYIVENIMIYLTFPWLADSLIIWGQGFKVNTYGDIDFPRESEVYYWGDLDAHGLLILSGLRKRYPKVKNLLMTEDVFNKYRTYSVAAPPCVSKPPDGLFKEERRLYALLNQDLIRLEQERIPQSEVIAAVNR